MQFFKIIIQRGCLCFLLVSFFSLLNSQIHAATNSSNYSLKFSGNNRLSLDARNVPLGSLLEDIKEKTGLKLKIHKDHIDQRVSVYFKSLSPEKFVSRGGLEIVIIFSISFLELKRQI
jgi:hypothetical protein